MKRFIKELFFPSLKCKRIGHKTITESIKIRKEGGLGSVVEDFKAKIKTCSRCGDTIRKPYGLKLIESYTGCSMPDYCWDEIRENGYMVLDD